MKSVSSGVAFAVALIGCAVFFAPPSYADKSTAFGEANHEVICNYVGQEPTPHGIWAANSVLLTQQPVGYELNYSQMQAAIGYAISKYCTQYSSIYSAYRTRYP